MLRVGFGGLVNTIEVSAIQPEALRAAALVAPDGTLVPATDITVSANPRISTGQWSLSHTWNVAVDPANTLAALVLPSGQGGAALYSDQQLLTTVSRATIPLSDPVAYRRDWRDWRVRLTLARRRANSDACHRRPRAAAAVAPAIVRRRRTAGNRLTGAGASVIEAMPAATFSPVLPWKLTGCSEIVLLFPPISALTAPPTPTVAPAVAPP